MPKKKKGSGFTHTKTGHNKDRRGGGGRVTRGERRYPIAGSLERPGSSHAHNLDNESNNESNESAQTSNSHVASLQFADGNAPDIGTGVATEETHQECEVVMAENVRHTYVQESILYEEPPPTVLEETYSLFKLFLPPYWKVIQGRIGFHLLCLSRGDKNISIQREVFAAFGGGVELFVHQKLLSEDFHLKFLKDVLEPVPLSVASVKSFVDRNIKVVQAVRGYEICAGSDKTELESFWKSDDSGFVDNNPYQESRYVKTFRSHSCSLLVPVQTWSCPGCRQATRRLKDRLKTRQENDYSFAGRNDYLDEEQKQAKLKELKRQLKNAKQKIHYLENKVRLLIEAEGVNLDKDMSEILNEILQESKLTPVQQLFIQQQYKMSCVKGATGMRWHPTMIRFALLIKSQSSGAYASIVNSGVIRLPAERTLFDYEHAIPRTEGVFNEKLKNVGRNVQSYSKDHQHYHNLLMDEEHICQKLVYRKSDGSLVGYVKLSEAEAEMAALTNTLNDGKLSELKPALATKILAYMVKGCTNSVKEVVAAFPVATLTREQLFDKTSTVIRACEGVGVKILSVICDGSSVNRAFIKMHEPASQSASGVVFDTVNLCALDRKLYFIADPPHLLKTIRNCFAKSGFGPKCTRLLFKDGEYIEWNTIKRLYKEDLQCTFRKSYKLNSQNVNLNSYSCMKVSYAAQVMSKTVALDLKSRNWPGTNSTVDLLLRTNDFFDNLNGAHTDQEKHTANPRLAAYRDMNDVRFEELLDFELYLLNWEEEVKSLTDVPDKHKVKMTLSDQTVEGIYITVNAFTAVVKFLLEKGADFVNARVFCQDPLEQYFGKQRASGGSVNPTVNAFINTDVRISVHRDVNVRKRSGNTEAFAIGMQIDDEPLPKRRKSF